MDLSPRPKAAVSTVTSASSSTSENSGASELVEPTESAIEIAVDSTTSVTLDKPVTNTECIVDTQMPSCSYSDINGPNESVKEYIAEPVVTTDAVGIPDFDDSFTALNVEAELEQSSFIGEISLLIDENGFVSVNPSPPKTDNNNHKIAKEVNEPSNAQTCPPELALAAVECGLTHKKKRKYEHSFNLGTDLPNDSCFQTWRVLKGKVAEIESKSESKCDATNEAQNVINHPLVKAGLIPSDLVDVLVVPQASTGSKAKGKRIKKAARVLTCDEVQKEHEERD